MNPGADPLLGVSLENELFERPIPQLIIRKALPMVLGIFAILLFTLVDTWFISLLGTEPLAAMSFTFPITFIVTSLAMGMGIGLGANVGRFLGSGRHELAERFTTDSLLLTFILVALLSGLGLWIHDPLFRMLGASDSILAYIRDYMIIWFVGIPLLVIPMVGNSAIRASGNIRTPSLVMLLSGVLNGILDPIFIFWLDMGIRGAAIATVISWMVTFAFAFHMLKNRLHLITLEPLRWTVLFSNWRQLAKIGLPASLAQMLNPLTNAIVVSILSAYGVASVAAFGVGARLEGIILIFVISVGSIMPTILGQNYGAHRLDRSAQTIRVAIRGILVLYLSLYGVIYFLAAPLSALFTEDPEVLALATQYLKIIPLSYAGLAVGVVFSQILNTLHQSVSSLMINLVRLFLIAVPCAWLGGKFFGVVGLYSGIAFAHISSGIVLYFYAIRLATRIESEGLEP